MAAFGDKCYSCGGWTATAAGPGSICECDWYIEPEAIELLSKEDKEETVNKVKIPIPDNFGVQEYRSISVVKPKDFNRRRV